MSKFLETNAIVYTGSGMSAPKTLDVKKGSTLTEFVTTYWKESENYNSISVEGFNSDYFKNVARITTRPKASLTKDLNYYKSLMHLLVTRGKIDEMMIIACNAANKSNDKVKKLYAEFNILEKQKNKVSATDIRVASLLYLRAVNAFKNEWEPEEDEQFTLVDNVGNKLNKKFGDMNQEEKKYVESTYIQKIPAFYAVKNKLSEEFYGLGVGAEYICSLNELEGLAIAWLNYLTKGRENAVSNILSSYNVLTARFSSIELGTITTPNWKKFKEFVDKKVEIKNEQNLNKLNYIN